MLQSNKHVDYRPRSTRNMSKSSIAKSTKYCNRKKCMDKKLAQTSHTLSEDLNRKYISLVIPFSDQIK